MMLTQARKCSRAKQKQKDGKKMADATSSRKRSRTETALMLFVLQRCEICCENHSEIFDV
jgi:hypothetical protein